MDKRILRNYFYNVLYQVVVLALPFFTTAYLSRTLGIESLGISEIVSARVQWFALFGVLGMQLYGIREIAKARDDKETLSKTFFELFVLQVVMVLLVSVLFLLSLQFQTTYLLYSYMQLLALVTAALDIAWFFYGIEDYKIASLRNIFVRILGVVLMYLLVKSPADLGIFIFINLGTSLFAQLIMLTQLRKYIRFVKVTLSGVMKHFWPNVLLFFPQLASSVFSLINVSLLEKYSPQEVQLYKQAQNFIRMFLLLITSIGQVVLARVANIYAKKEEAKTRELLEVVMLFAFFAAIPMIGGLCVVVPNFIPWFLPADFQPVTGLIIVASPMILFLSMTNVYGVQYMIPAGLMKQYVFSIICGIIVNLGLDLLLLPSYQSLGSTIANVCGEAVVLIVQMYLLKDKLKLKLDFMEIGRISLSAAIMIVAVYGFSQLLSWQGSSARLLLQNGAQALLGVGIYLTSMILLRSSFLKLVIDRLKRKNTV
ncbi:MAG: polysaccharide biosynthesis C-terminal domain-containing protein [Erysipelotrichaceae bacterium]|nr:polysaccharide biosynthesis C-terminal domain-containing protein [Erysipelotrichaceae bacterium]